MDNYEDELLHTLVGQREREIERKRKNMIVNKLLRIGVKSNLSGFNCLVDAIIVYKPGMQLTTDGGLYEKLGVIHDIDGRNAERRIRHAKNCFIKDLDKGILPLEIRNNYLLGRVDMTNGEFISTLKLIIEDELGNEVM